MKLYSIIRVVLDEDLAAARPDVVEQIHRALTRVAEPRTRAMPAAARAALVVAGHRLALAAVRSADAEPLIDDVLVLADRERPADLRRILHAFVQCAPEAEANYRVLQTTAGRVSGGIHFVLELQVRAGSSLRCSRVFVSGRLTELHASVEPRAAARIIDCHEATAVAA